MGAMFDEADLAQQQRLKCAFDPDGLLNPGKVFPELHRCAELGRLHVHHGAAAASRTCRGSDHSCHPGRTGMTIGECPLPYGR